MDNTSVTAPSLRDLGYLTETETASLYRVQPVTLRNWRSLGLGPPWTKVHGNFIAYPIEGVRRDLERRTVTPTSPPTLTDGRQRRRTSAT